MSGNDNARETRSGRSIRTRKRTLLKALGAGAGLSAVGSGVTLGQQAEDDSSGTDAGDDGTMDDADDGDGGVWCPPCIDRLAGYTCRSLDADLSDDGLEPDHAVEMYVDDADVLFPEADDAEVPPSELDPTDEGEPEDQAEAFPDFYFDPVGLRIAPGDIVSFPNLSEAEHTITAIHPRFFGLPQHVPDGVPGFSSPPVMPDERWLYQFDEPGVYDYMCLPHFDLGMVGRLVVMPEDADEAPEAPPLAEDALPPAVSAVLGADQLDPSNVAAEGSVAWADLEGNVPTFDPNELFGGE